MIPAEWYNRRHHWHEAAYTLLRIFANMENRWTYKAELLRMTHFKDQSTLREAIKFLQGKQYIKVTYLSGEPKKRGKSLFKVRLTKKGRFALKPTEELFEELKNEIKARICKMEITFENLKEVRGLFDSLMDIMQIKNEEVF